MNSQFKYVAIFNFTFFLGYLFRILTFGWLMFVLAIPEYLFRSFYYIVGRSLLDKEYNPSTKWLNFCLQASYLMTSFLSYDGDDKSTYTFAHLWINPQERNIEIAWVLSALITITLLLITIYFLFKKKTTVKAGFINKAAQFLLIGCVGVPIFALGVGMFLLHIFGY